MLRLGLIGLITAVAILSAGCAHTSITGSGGRYAYVLYGDVGITGEDNELTVKSGSEVHKLSIMGEDIRVIVEDGALLEKVEIVGEDNEVRYPAGMLIEYSELGESNRMISVEPDRLRRYTDDDEDDDN